METLSKENISKLELIDDDVIEPGEAFASVALSPLYRWVKFILTDDKPNLNGQRIPQEEFGNLIQSGIHAPIKMGANEIKRGHGGAFPLGVITHLTQAGDKILGLAALWKKEREEDVQLVKELFDKKVPLNLSWEIYYTDSSKEDDGTEVLHGTALGAATLVGLPAYGGRTQVLSLASQEDKLTEDEIKQLQEKLLALEKQVETLTAESSKKDETITALTTEKETLEQDRKELAEFKKSVEDQKALAEKMANIKQKFNDAKIVKDDQYFNDNQEKLLKLDEAGLEFFLQELVSFKNSEASVNDPKLPKMVNDDITNSPKTLGKLLRESR